jgi:hypothetical protein
LVAAELWKQLDAKDEDRSVVLIKLAFESLKAARWKLSEGISFFVMNDKQLSERDQLVGRINYWQALKWQGRFDEIRSHVEQADLFS